MSNRPLARLAATLALCASTLVAHAQSSCSVPGGDGPVALSTYPNAIYIPSGTASAGSTSLSLASRRATGGAPADDIRAGDLLLIVQAQDASFDSSNSASYGGTSTGSGYTSLGNSGYYEYATVSASLAAPISSGTVPLASPLLNTYYQSGATGSSGQRRYQVLRVPQYSTVTLSGTITAPVWDGFSGGIIAIEAAGALNWGSATLDASARGFRGGGGQCSTSNGTGTAMTWQEFRSGFGSGAVNLAGTGNVPNGAKGEGVAGAPILVFIPTTPNNGNSAGAVRWMCNSGETATACPTEDGSTAGYPGGSFGRGAPGNGGGGSTDGNPTANDQNTGGAGGGNYSAGGHGGYGWTPTTPPGQDGGGFGGAAVPGSPSRIFFGGGGGSATSNNCTGTPAFGAAGSGASGGGIVFVRVGSVAGSGTINVQGGSANSTIGNDASGGGGAGGTALVFVNNSGGSTGATINASGGNGGSNTGGGAPHGPGGGGSGGFVVLSGSASFNVNGGVGGTTATSPTSTFDYGATASAGGVQYVGLTASQIPGAGASPACYPQLTVSKTTSTPNVAQGGIATYTITATNAAGRGTARTARLADVLPATPNFTFGATNNILLGGGATRPVILDPTAAATTPIWGDFNIPGGGTVSIEFNVNVLAPTPPGTYQNPATIDYLDPTRTAGAARVTPGGTHQSGGTVAAGSNYVATSTTNEDVTVRAPVALTKSFAPTSISDNGVTTLTIVFANPNATALANAAITDNYPAGMENASVPAAATTCGGTVTAVAGASSFTLANATIPASPATCQVTVNVTATVAQAYTNTLPPGALTNTQNVSNANATATLLARPRVTKSFTPIAVPANTDSTLSISIVNPNAATALTGVQLTDVFPPGLVATNGTVSYGGGCTTFTNAAFGAGASTFTITGGTIAAGATCVVTFAVRAGANGSYPNTTSGATSTQTPQAGNASNTASLGVGVVNISKAFAPATIRTGQTSTITFTLVNPTNVVQTNAAFADSLVNMSVANAAVGGTCVGTTPATLSLGATSLSFSGITVPAGVPTGSCTVTVVVTSSTVGTQNNTSSGVSTALLPQGPASNTAPLTVIGPPTITKSFSPAAIGPGTNSTLTFTLNNPNSVALTGLSFTDTYPIAPGALVNATPIVIGGSCTGVTSTATAGGGTFNVSVGNFPAGSACTITVPVSATVPGTYNNTTSAVTTVEAAASAPSNTAQLTVLAAPTIAKSFTPPTIGAGGTSTVTFTLNNPNASALTNARFTDSFTNMTIGAAGVGGTCSGVFGVPTPAIGDAFVDLRVPTLGPGTTCTVTVVVRSSTVGVQPNVASGVTSTETPTAGTPSNNADLTVLATPTIGKSFAPGQIQTGGTSTITFTLANPNATALNLVTFTDTLANMTVASTTTGGTCTGVTFPFTALTVGGTVIAPRLATLAGGASCTLTVQVTSSVVSPAAGHVNTTTGVTSTETTTPGATASANLNVLGAPTIVKSFSPATVAANNPTTMTFTITNPNPVPLTGGLFTDTFTAGLTIRNVTQSFVGPGRGTCPAAIPAGMVAGSPPPTAPTFTMNAVQIPANSSCTITIDMVATASGTYNNTTSGMTTTQTPTAGPASNTAVLQVNAGPTLAKTFVTNPIQTGANTVMRFTLTNPNLSGVTLTNVAFTDTLTNMTVNSATMAGTSTCTGVTFSPALTVGGTAVNPTVASMAPNTNCTIDITVTSAVISTATGHLNTTSAPTAFQSPAGGVAASANLFVAAPPTVTKTIAPGGVVNNATDATVTLVLSNPNPIALTAATITDTFPVGITARAAPAPTLTGCGAGTVTNTGGGAVTNGDLGVRVNAATIPASGTCTVTFTIRGAVGTYTNTTSLYSATYDGPGAVPAIILTGNNASDNFAVGQATITKAFGAATIALNATTTLTLTVINNSGANFTGTLNFLDTFPVGALVVHTTPAFANTCGGTVVSGNTSGNTSVQITNGTVNNGASCTVTVTVRALLAGTLSNTVNATAPAAINGRSDTAVLNVLAPPTVAKSWSPSTLPAAGGTSTLTITLGNTNSVPITGVAFTDLFPAAPAQMTVANTTTTNTCGGVLDENDAADADNTYEVGDRSVRLTGGTIPAGGCVITVNVAAPATPGSYTNTLAVGAVTSTNAGANAVAGSAVLTVPGTQLTKTFSPASVGLGSNATLVFTISKTAAVATQTGLGFTDTLPSGITVAATPNILTNCPAGGAFAAPGFSVTAAGSSIAVSGASINVGVATCQVQVNVTPTQAITTCPVAANTNDASNISALAGGIQNSVSSQCLSVTTAIPAFTKAFSPTTIATGGTTNLTFTVTQPAGNGTQTFSFNDTLPSGLVIQSATVTGTCTGGTVTAPVDGNTITVSGRQISGTTCTIIVAVKTAPAPTVGACPGTPPNTNGAAQISGASNITSSVTDQCVTVTAAPPSLAKAFSPLSIPQGGVSTLTFTVTNGAGNPAQASFGFTDTFPLGLVVAGVPNTSTTCGSAAITANAGAGLVTIAGASLALGQASCIVRVDVTAAAANTYTNATANIGGVTGGLVTTGISAPLTVYASAALTKAFNPLAIAPGQVSLLTFTITNGAGNPAQAGLAFTDVLPSNVVVAPAPGVQTNCPAGAGFGSPGGGMTVGASAGGGSISVAGAAINAAVASCQVRVNVTSATAGTYPNTSANVSGLAGGLTAGGVSSTLSVSTASLGKAFNPLSIGAGGVSQLTFIVTNGAGNPAQSGLAFTDNLPSGLVVATPNGLVNGCGGSVTAVATSTSVALSAGTLASGAASCTIQVNVTAASPASYSNTSGNITGSAGLDVSGVNATLTVTRATLTKAFTGANLAIGGTTTIAFTITNSAGNPAQSGIGFTDTLPAGLAVSGAGSAQTNCPAGGALGAIPGGMTVTAGGNSIAVSGAALNLTVASCEVRVTITPSATPTVGACPQANNTNDLTNVSALANVINGVTSQCIPVFAAPVVSKVFGAPDVALNGTTTLTLTITNPVGNAGALTGLAVSDTFPAGLQVAATPGLTNTCGGTVSPGATAGDTVLTLAGGTSLAAGASCQVQVNVTATTVGTKNNTTGTVSATGPVAITGNTASAILTVSAPPTISKLFNATTIAAGGISRLTFTLTNPAGNVSALTGVAFNDTLPTSPGAMRVATPPNVSVTGCGSPTFAPAANDPALAFSNATIAVGGTCTVAVDVTAPAAGTYNNVSGAVSATGPAATTGGTASATLTVLGAPTFSKLFTASTIAAGGTSTLTFTIVNPAGNTQALTGLAFTDVLPTTPGAMTVATTPAISVTGCGAPTFAPAGGATSLSFSGGTVAVGGTCTVSVNVTATVPGVYTNTSGAIAVGGPVAITGSTSTANLTVHAPPTIAKLFGPSTIGPGGVSTLTFTLTNPAGNTAPLTGVAFADSLPIAPAAMLVAGTPNATTTGCGSPTFAPAANAATLNFSGGTIAVGGTCTVTVDVTAPLAGTYNNTSGAVSASGPVALSGGTAASSLTVTQATLTKAFTPAAVDVGVTSTLIFTLTNGAGNPAQSGINFIDTLPANVTVTGTPTSTCPSGAGAVSAVGNVITVTGASMSLAQASCTISVGVVASAAGTYANTDATNISGRVRVTTTGVNSTLTVSAIPALTKAFGAASVGIGNTTTLQFSIANTAPNALARSALSFTDQLPAGIVIANPAAPSSTNCGTPTFTAVDNTQPFTASAIAVAAGQTCTITLTVRGTVLGTQTNNAASITAISGMTNGVTPQSLQVVQPSLDKAFSPTTIAAGGTSTLTFTLTNGTGNPLESGIGFTDNLPGNVRVAAAPNVQTNCPAGGAFAAPGFTVTAPAGAAAITVSGATMNAVASCQVRVDVTAAIGGAYTNDTTRIAGTANITNSVTPSTLTVNNVAPTIAKLFGTTPIAPGAISTLTITLTNANATVADLGVALVDTLPAGVTIAATPNATTNCPGSGAVVAASGGNTVTLPATRDIPAATGVTPGTCTVSVDVTASLGGSYVNTIAAGALQTDKGNNAVAATHTLVVNNAAPTIAKLFGTTPIAAGGTSVLTITLTNPNNTAATLSTALVDTLPAGVTAVAATVADSCPGVNATQTAGSVTLPVGLQVPAGTAATPGTCTVTVTTTAALGGSYVNTIAAGALQTDKGNNAAATTHTLVVNNAAPTISKLFATTPIAAGGTSTLTITLTNPNNTAATLSSALLDTFPAGLTAVAATVAGSCSGTAPTQTAGSVTLPVGLQIPAGTVSTPGTCTVTVTTTAALGGSYVNTIAAGALQTDKGNNAAAATHTLVVSNAAPTISKLFGTTPIAAGGTSVLTITLTNPNNTAATLSTALVDTLPTGVTTVAATVAGTCSGTAPTQAAGSVTLPVGLQIPAGTASTPGTCNVTVTTTASLGGSYVNTIAAGALQTDKGNNAAVATHTLVVNNAAPTIAKLFATTPIAAGGTSTLTITLSNPNNTVATLGTALVDTFPAGLTAVAATVAGTCSGTAPTQTGGSVTLPVGLQIPAGTASTPGTCAVTVTTTAALGGSYVNTIAAGALQTDKGNNVAATTHTLVVNNAAPTIAKLFGTTPIAAGGTSTLTITLTNPNNTAATLSSALVDTLPTGVTAVAATVTGTCSGTAPTQTAGSVTLPVGLQIPAGTVSTPGTCTVSVTTTASLGGSYVNTIAAGALQTDKGNNAAATTHTLVVNNAAPTIAKLFGTTPIAAGGTSVLTITLGNPNNTVATLGTALVDTLPAGLTAVAATVADTCPGTNATQTGGSVTLPVGLQIPAGTVSTPGTCTVTVTTTAALGGSYVNTIAAGALQTDKGNNAAATTHTLVVNDAAPTVTKLFGTTPIAAGGISTLTITLTNANTTVADLSAALVDTLPAGVTIAATPNATTTCAGSGAVVATSGGSTVTLPATRDIPAGTGVTAGFCTVSVDVTATLGGSYVNTIAAGALQTDKGNNAAAATHTLVVNNTAPTISKLFGTTPIAPGGTSTLTITLTNPNNTTATLSTALIDTLPTGVTTVAATVAGTCSGTAPTQAGGSVTLPVGLQIPAGTASTPGTCTVTVTTTAALGGSYVNTIAAGALQTDKGNNAAATTHTLVVNTAAPSIAKLFATTPIAAGGTSTLTITLSNPNNTVATLGTALVDTFPAGLTAVAATVADTCPGTNATQTGGSVTMPVGLQIPAGTASTPGTCTVTVTTTASLGGSYVNTIAAGALQTDKGNNAAATTHTLVVNNAAPTITKLFNTTPIAAGGTSTLTITLSNPNNTAATLGTALVDTLPTGVTTVAATVAGTCSGTAPTQTGGSVTLPVGLQIPAGTASTPGTCSVTVTTTAALGGSYVNTIAAGALQTDKGNNAAATTHTLVVNNAAPTTSKLFGTTPIAAGGTSTLTITLTNPNSTAATLSSALVDTLPTGVTTVAATVAGTCSGTAPTQAGGSVTLPVGLQIPAGTVSTPGTCTVSVTTTASLGGSYVNTIAAGALQTDKGNNAAATTHTLVVNNAAPTISKLFATTPIAAGGTSTLTLTLGNPNNTAATLSAALVDTFPAGLTAVAATVAGTCSGTAPTQTGGSITLPVGLQIPAGTAATPGTCTVTVTTTAALGGSYVNTIAAGALQTDKGNNAAATTHTLVVNNAAPSIAKLFGTTPIAAGGTSTLTITLTNPNSTAATLSSALVDTLPAGVTTVAATVTGTCSGTAPTQTGGSVTLPVGLQIPAGTVSTPGTCTVSVTTTAALGGSYVNTIAAGALQTDKGNNAAATTHTLVVNNAAPTITKLFGTTPIAAGGTSTLTITLTNPNNTAATLGTALVDTLPGGVTAVAATVAGSCSGTAPTQTSGSVTLPVGLQIPAGTAATPGTCTVTVTTTAALGGSYVNTIAAGALQTDKGNNAAATTHTLVVNNAAPTISKLFGPTPIAAGGTSTLTITLTNPNINAATLSAALTDTLPTGVTTVAATVVGTCSGTAPTQATGSVTLPIGLQIPAGTVSTPGTCTVSVTVTAALGGSYVNTIAAGALQTDKGNNAAATTHTLVVNTAAPTIAKIFSPATVNANAISQLTITLTNANSSTATLTAALTDTLPAPVVVATPANASTDCLGAGALVATAGTGVITLPAGRQIPAGSGATAGSCTITVDVVSPSGGVFTNTIAAGALQTSSGNNAAPASAVLTVNAAAPSIAKAFLPVAIAADGTSTVTLTISNANAFALTGAGFGDTLVNMSISGNQNAAGSCAGANTNALTAGQTAVAISGLTIPAAVGVTPGACTVTFIVTSDVPGVNNNATTGVASANAPTGAVSNTATLTVSAAAPTIVKSFTPPSIAYGATSTVTLTIANANGIALTAAGFTDTLANMSIAGAQTALGSCTGANGNNLTAGQTAVAISGLTIPANSSCTVTFVVTSTTPGVHPNATSGVASAQAATGAVSNTVNLTVTAAAPTVTKAFVPSTIGSGAPATLQVSINNPNGAAITGVNLTDTFPLTPGAGLVRAATPNASANAACGGGTVGSTSGSVSITGATIAAGATCVFQIDVQAATAGSYTNTIPAGALASSAGTNAAPASATLTVTPVANLAINKTGPATVALGGAIAYVITITNAGPDAANLATFADVVPSPITGLSAICAAAGGATCGTVNIAGQTVTSTITALPVGGTITITVSGTVSSIGTISNTATVTAPAGTTDPVTGNNSSTANTAILAPDLTIAKSHVGNFSVGTNGVYTIAVGNGGAAATSGTVTVTDSLPAGLGFVSAVGAGWTCGFAAPTVTCTSAAVIAAGANAPPITLTVSVASTAVPSVLNFASVAGGGEPAAYTGNNQSGDNTIVTSPGVNTFVPDGAQTGMPGTVVFYPHTFTAASAGSVAFTTTNVPSPVIPGWTQLVYRDTDCSGTLSTAEGVTPLTAAVPVNAGETICIVVKDNIPPMAPYNARNVITVTSTFNGSSTIARTDTTTVGALAGAGLTLAKAVRNVTQGGASGTSNQALPNDVLEYTITYTNTGTSAVSAIVVTDATPAFTTYLAGACTTPLAASLTGCAVTSQPAVNGSGSVVWTLSGSLNSGGSGSVTYTVRVAP